METDLFAEQALDESDSLVGVVVSKLERHRSGTNRGYIAMLAVREEHRGKGIATKLVCMAIDAMKDREADEVRMLALILIARRIYDKQRIGRSRDRGHKRRFSEAL